MKLAYSRIVATATTAQLMVQVPSGCKIKRVEVHVLTVPFVALGTADTATCNVRLCSLIEASSVDASTWLFGMETVQAFQPLVWQGELKISDDFNAKIYLDIELCTVGNQIELAVTFE